MTAQGFPSLLSAGLKRNKKGHTGIGGDGSFSSGDTVYSATADIDKVVLHW